MRARCFVHLACMDAWVRAPPASHAHWHLGMPCHAPPLISSLCVRSLHAFARCGVPLEVSAPQPITVCSPTLHALLPAQHSAWATENEELERMVARFPLAEDGSKARVRVVLSALRDRYLQVRLAVRANRRLSLPAPRCLH